MCKVLPFIGSQDPILLSQQEDFPSIVALLHIGQMDLETYKTTYGTTLSSICSSAVAEPEFNQAQENIFCEKKNKKKTWHQIDWLDSGR